MATQNENEKLELLKQVDIFSALQNHELKTVARFSDFLDFSTGDSIFKEGDPGNALYIVLTGEVLIQKREEYSEGPHTQIARFVAGNEFGELDLFSAAVRQADAVADQDTRLLQFPSSNIPFETFLDQHPDISAQVLHRILVVITERIRSANELVKENSPLVQALKRQVYRDKLTGVYNQAFLTETIRDKINKESTPFALLISKPDNFKDLNDSYGHDIGDKAIRLMAKGLRDFIGDDNRIARFKGNAMAFIYPEINREQAFEKAKEIRSYLEQLDLSELTGSDIFHFSASIGIGLYPDHSSVAETLIDQTHEIPLIGRRLGGGKILFLDEVDDK